ncbi:hypothetical protein SDC9_38109 [bioreactor metagenome]|uniref:Uncharacterized protein n=1 Tax=bioreactor metagenome TaxID=1076179 RepID=A0A644VKZ4_9ZZZZ
MLLSEEIPRRPCREHCLWRGSRKKRLSRKRGRPVLPPGRRSSPALLPGLPEERHRPGPPFQPPRRRIRRQGRIRGEESRERKGLLPEKDLPLPGLHRKEGFPSLLLKERLPHRRFPKGRHRLRRLRSFFGASP